MIVHEFLCVFFLLLFNQITDIRPARATFTPNAVLGKRDLCCSVCPHVAKAPTQ